MTPAALTGLDLLATAVILVDTDDVLRHMNPAAENLLELSHANVVGQSIAEVFTDHDVLAAALDYARRNNCSFSEHDLLIAVSGRPRMHFTCTVTPIERDSGFDVDGCIVEFRPIEQQLRIAREERLLDQTRQAAGRQGRQGIGRGEGHGTNLLVERRGHGSGAVAGQGPQRRSISACRAPAALIA